MKSRLNARLAVLLIALLLGAGMLMSVMALGIGQSVTDDYGISVSAGMSMYECEDGYVWAPSPTNINGQCVPAS